MIPVDTARDIAATPFMWGKLLRAIRYEQVIPIIGPELLPYHLSLAPALASEMRVSPACAELGIGAVADAAGGSGDAATEALSVLLQGYTRRTPTALADLASIDEFRLIFTTDYISLVEQALFEAGRRCKTLGFALRRRADSVQAYPDAEEPCVYHLLGHLDRFGAIALPRAKQLEYLYSLTTGRSNLLGVLSESKNLLFLGCNFPEWIAGLFTRMLLGKPLYESRESLEVVACSGHQPHGGASFTGFLRDNRVEIYPGDAASFVSELARRYRATAQPSAWSFVSKTSTDRNEPARHDSDRSAPDTEPARASRSERATPDGTEGLRPPLRGHTFISYCHADRPAAKTLAHQLTSRGVSVWFDERDVPPGTLVDDAIRLAIEDDSAAFIAVISRTVFQTHKAYFLREWKCAAEAQLSYPPGAPFTFPVVVDDLSVSEAVTGLRSFFPPWAESNLEACRAGRVTDELVAALRNARKRFERRRVYDTRRQ